MSPYHPLFAIVVYAIAFLTTFLIQQRYKDKNASSRYETIDGLRGFLALGVFIHHATIWFRFLRTAKWSTPPSNLYNHLGGTCVLFFFMITGFLFVSKLLMVRHTGINWNHFFVSRIFRLFPMYYFSLALVVVTVMILSSWNLYVSWGDFWEQLSHWMFFNIDTMPDLNHIKKTFVINAGVTWSLSYEWLFYFVLPVLSLFVFRKHQKPVYIGLGIAFIIFYFYLRGAMESDIYLIGFVGGAIPAVLLRYTHLAERMKGRVVCSIVSLVIIACLIAIVQYRYVTICTILLSTVVFTLVALGNSMFGLLRLQFVSFLGDISYSTYLLHGIILFYAFRFLIGIKTMQSFTAVQYSFVIFAVVPVVVVLSYLTYRFIEKPLMRYGKNIIKRRAQKQIQL